MQGDIFCEQQSIVTKYGFLEMSFILRIEFSGSLQLIRYTHPITDFALKILRDLQLTQFGKIPAVTPGVFLFSALY
ncbi:MAG: hypothetical protein MRK00_05985 [Nitrosomonas sp.]|nr:hypothetical protein [Nitrosomonas sp.]